MRWQRQIAPRERSIGGGLFVIPFVLLGAFSLVVRSASSSADFHVDQEAVLEELKQKIERQLPDAAAAPPSALREVREVVRKGDNLASILRRIGVNDAEALRWSASSRSHASLARLQPGRPFVFLVPSGTDRLAGLQYPISPESTLVMRDENGDVVAEIERLPRMTDVTIVAGSVENNFYASALRRGVPDSVISTVVDVFGWEIDFTSDLQAGDSFRVAFEPAGARGGRGARLLAAELRVKRKLWRAVYFEAADGGTYYAPDGRPFGRSFLRYPVEFTRISSQFLTSRFHPILGVRRPHLGVDFAAPIGTPIRAIASGRVEMAGWNGGFGRFVKIDHGAGLESSYSHLSSFARGIRAGAHVQIGQVIGSVGASGLATGPHLHFAVFRNGVYVNPMTARLPAQPPLATEYMGEFARARDELLAELATSPASPTVTATAGGPPAS